MLAYLILGATYAFAAAVQPGPLQAYLVSQSLSHGWRRSLPAAFSPLVSDGPIILLVLLVLTRVPPWLALGLRAAGGVVLLVLAAQALRAWRRFDARATAPRPPSARESLLAAALVNLSSPGPYLGWSLIMGPLLLKGWREGPARGIALVAGFYTVLVLGMAGTVLLPATARGLGPRVSRALLGASAAAFAGLGCWQLGSVVAALR